VAVDPEIIDNILSNSTVVEMQAIVVHSSPMMSAKTSKDILHDENQIVHLTFNIVFTIYY